MAINLLELLKSCKIFSSVDEDELKKLLGKFKKVSLPKNSVLFKHNDLSHSLYLLVSGKMGLYLNGKNKRILINEVLPGSLFGEITALSYEPRSTTARTLKKSILLELPSEEFIVLCKKFPLISFEVINTSLAQSRRMMRFISEESEAKKHIVVMPANEEIPLKVIHNQITTHIKDHEETILISDAEYTSQEYSVSKLKETIREFHKQNKSIVYLLESLDSNLAKACFDFEKVDMIYVFAFGNGVPAISNPIKNIINLYRYKIEPEIILLYDNHYETPKRTSAWLNLLDFSMHHHIRTYREEDWQRLLRFITGKAIGVVLGGGGLRCWAEFGALMALNRLKIPIDAIGGSSAGTIVAGYYAMRESLENPHDLRELSEITRKSASLKNLTWPAVSVFNGKDYTLQLQKIYKHARIENLWISCFCISTNLSNNKQVISRRGLLWKLVRSSTAVPLLFPPVVVKGKLRIDGGLLNNLPVDIMKKIVSNSGKVIAVELTRKNNEDHHHYYFPSSLPFWQTFLAKYRIAYKNYRFPNFIENFLKSLLAGSSAKQQENSLLADVLIAPDLSAFSLLNVKRKDENRLIKLGYKTTIKEMKKHARKLKQP